MPRSKIDWQSESANSRLLASLVATVDAVDYHKVAANFGQGATYWAIQNRFRTIQKEAAELKAAAPAAAPVAGRSTNKKATGNNSVPKGKVASGRVSKANKGTHKGSAKGKTTAEVIDDEQNNVVDPEETEDESVLPEDHGHEGEISFPPFKSTSAVQPKGSIKREKQMEESTVS